MNNNYWLKIEKFKFKNALECLNSYDEKKFKFSPWIEDIVKKNNYVFNQNLLPVKLVRKSLKELGYNKPIELEEVYESIKKHGLGLVTPEIAIYARLLYLDQPNGEWLRFATPFDSMIDTDGVPHLPKLGKALKSYFIETYWSYPKAIFHPHNDFILISK